MISGRPDVRLSPTLMNKFSLPMKVMSFMVLPSQTRRLFMVSLTLAAAVTATACIRPVGLAASLKSMRPSLMQVVMVVDSP